MAHFDIKGDSNPGIKRTENQDRFIIGSSQQTSIKGKGCLIAVADGMGGHKGGALAAEMAVNTLITDYYQNPSEPITDSLKKAFFSANQKIYEMASKNKEYEGMGTTLTAVVLMGSYFYYAHVGDSRGYIVSTMKIKQFTRDHSIVGDLIAEGIITEKEAEKHPDRNIITRAIGTDPTVEIDISTGAIQLKNRQCILLCSDGLIKVVQKREIKKIIHKTKDAEKICKTLIKKANGRGGPDNITVVIAIQKKTERWPLLHKIKQLL